MRSSKLKFFIGKIICKLSGHTVYDQDMYDFENSNLEKFYTSCPRCKRKIVLSYSDTDDDSILIFDQEENNE